MSDLGTIANTLAQIETSVSAGRIDSSSIGDVTEALGEVESSIKDIEDDSEKNAMNQRYAILETALDFEVDLNPETIEAKALAFHRFAKTNKLGVDDDTYGKTVHRAKIVINSYNMERKRAEGERLKVEGEKLSTNLSSLETAIYGVPDLFVQQPDKRETILHNLNTAYAKLDKRVSGMSANLEGKEDYKVRADILGLAIAYLSETDEYDRIESRKDFVRAIKEKGKSLPEGMVEKYLKIVDRYEHSFTKHDDDIVDMAQRDVRRSGNYLSENDASIMLGVSGRDQEFNDAIQEPQLGGRDDYLAVLFGLHGNGKVDWRFIATDDKQGIRSAIKKAKTEGHDIVMYRRGLTEEGEPKVQYVKPTK